MNLSDFLRSEQFHKPFVAVLGHPVGHSLSPMIHNASLEEHQIEATYHAIDCPEHQWVHVTKLLASPSCLGANITLPLKQKIMDYLDKNEESAREIGAVNTVVPEYGGEGVITGNAETGDRHSSRQGSRRVLSGYNTDAFGFIKPLEQRRGITCATVLGSGGASRAVNYALSVHGIETIYLVSRRVGDSKTNDSADPGLNSRTLKKTHIKPVSYSDLLEAVKQSQLIVNTTPLGMYPQVAHTPFPEEALPFLDGKICYDIIYNPLETKFMADAKKHGAEIISGLDMFIYQAAKAFELWFSKPMPVERVRKLILDHVTQSKS